MMSFRILSLGLTTFALIAARPSAADTISSNPFQTGNVETDFSKLKSTQTSVLQSATNLGESSFIPANGWVSGWAIQKIYTSYNAGTDTLYVGLDTFKNAKGVQGIVGDADGNGVAGGPNGASPGMKAAGGVENANLGGFESVAVAFAPNGVSGAGTPAIVAGVPADKSVAGKGLDGFTVSNFKNPNLGLAYNFGTQTQYKDTAGSLAFDPSAAHPGFEFSINKFSTLLGSNPKNGFWMSAYAGSPTDVVAGETSLGWTRVAPLPTNPAAEQTPEPAAILAWSLVLGAALVYRTRTRKAIAS